MLAGAALARGDVLWFLHADALLPADPLAVMTAAFEQGAAEDISVSILTPRAPGQRSFWSSLLPCGIVWVAFLMEIKDFLSHDRLISKLEIMLPCPYLRKYR